MILDEAAMLGQHMPSMELVRDRQQADTCGVIGHSLRLSLAARADTCLQ
jgi:hypothetical protein